MRISLRELMIVVAVAAVGLAGLKYASNWMLPVVQAMTGFFLLAFLVRAIVDRGQKQAFVLGFVSCGVMYLVSLVSIVDRDSTKTPVSGLGTSRALYELYSLLKTQQWVNENTNEVEPSIQATAAELNAGRVVRIELKPMPPDVSDKEKAGVAASNNADADGAVVAPRRGSRGGRGGGGGRGQRGGYFPIQLTPQQSAEYDAAENYLRNYYDEIFADPQGQAAVLSGRPLSTIIRHSYTRDDIPRLSDFQIVGYCLWTLLIGYAGGHFARYVYTRRMAERSTEA